jgi:hypothetical protein
MRPFVVLGLGLLLGVGAALAAAGSTVPVQVGGQADTDACSSQGQVKELDPKGDNFLSVRVGPGADFDEIDKLQTGDVVNLCDQRGGWHGIVYGAKDCGVGKPMAKRIPYLGVCKTGWVSGKFIVAVAG